MTIALEPSTLRMAPAVAPRVCDAVAAVKRMSVQELREQLHERRGTATDAREAAQRERAAAKAAHAAQALRQLS